MSGRRGAGTRGRGVGVLLALALGGCSGAPKGPTDVVVRDPFAFEAKVGATGALYAVVVNGTDSAETLDSITSTVGFVSMHDQVPSNGMVTMVPIDRPVIAAHAQVVLGFAAGDRWLVVLLAWLETPVLERMRHVVRRVFRRIGPIDTLVRIAWIGRRMLAVVHRTAVVVIVIGRVVRPMRAVRPVIARAFGVVAPRPVTRRLVFVFRHPTPP